MDEELTWNMMRSSWQTIYETPYPTSETGPKPPPADKYSGYSLKFIKFDCEWGV